jgi:hypothetical protein
MCQSPGNFYRQALQMIAVMKLETSDKENILS